LVRENSITTIDNLTYAPIVRTGRGTVPDDVQGIIDKVPSDMSDDEASVVLPSNDHNRFSVGYHTQ
jgi:hypothetical protein